MKTTFKVNAKEVEVTVTGDSVNVVRFLESLLKNKVITKDGSKIYPVVTEEVSDNDTNVIDGKYTVDPAPITIPLTQAEVNGILKASKTLYGSEDHGISGGTPTI